MKNSKKHDPGAIIKAAFLGGDRGVSDFDTVRALIEQARRGNAGMVALSVETVEKLLAERERILTLLREPSTISLLAERLAKGDENAFMPEYQKRAKAHLSTIAAKIGGS